MEGPIVPPSHCFLVREGGAGLQACGKLLRFSASAAWPHKCLLHPPVQGYNKCGLSRGPRRQHDNRELVFFVYPRKSSRKGKSLRPTRENSLVLLSHQSHA